MNQPLPLVEQLRNLEHLQEIDLKIDSLKKNQNSLPASLKALDDALNKVRLTVESKKNSIQETDKVMRQTQAALDLNRDRLARSNSKLETVQNSQEYQAATKEIEQLKKLNVSLEEQAGKLKSEIDSVQKEIETLSEQQKKLQADRESQATVLSGQDHQFKADIEALASQRHQYTSKVESRILSQYDRIRSARGGLGIVPTVGGRCKGCNMMVPPQLYNEVYRGSTLHSCPSCHRILFVPQAAQTSNAGTNSEAKTAE